MLASVVMLWLAAGQPAPQCSLLLTGKGYRENLDGQHVRYIASYRTACVKLHIESDARVCSLLAEPGLAMGRAR